MPQGGLVGIKIRHGPAALPPGWLNGCLDGRQLDRIIRIGARAVGVDEVDRPLGQHPAEQVPNGASIGLGGGQMAGKCPAREAINHDGRAIVLPTRNARAGF